ncbi:MAG: S49 family peptidase, partial [Oscillospiraceae bacterium]
KLGMEEIIISSGTNKGMGSAAQVLTKEQRDIYQGLVDESYDNFVNIVAQGRKIDKEKVIQLADGRVYTASQALENKLIDKVETWQEALDGMTELTGVECYEKNLMSNGSYLSYLIGEYKSATPKSDMQAVEEMLSKDLNGVPLYYYQR